MIGIIDYGAGNLFSVKNTLDHLGLKSRIVRSPDDTGGMKKLILPGVGHFGAAIRRLRQSRLDTLIQEWLQKDKPFLGICLGMQLLFERSEECEDGTTGFGCFAGSVVKLQGPRRLHMGWNQVQFKTNLSLFKDLPSPSYFYFVHGFRVQPENEDIIAAITDYGTVFPAVLRRGNILAVQFHPEKSGELGLRLMAAWGKNC
ncbi:MAG: imidazole glycerol phosphate synthase subunit HisH [Candidatus Aminicenantales bacterium]